MRIWTIAAGLTFAAASAAVPAVSAHDSKHEKNDKAIGAISAGKLAKHAGDYYGKTVIVTAEVEDVLGSNMFTLDEDAILAGADVLVLVPMGVADGLMPDQKVTVEGVVRKYVEKDLDKDFDWFKNGKLVDVKTKVEWDTRPVIVARSVRTATGADWFRTSDKRMTTAPAVVSLPTATTTKPNMISAGKLAKNPKDYYGKTVTVKAEVEDVLGSNMFTLDEDAILAGSDVLVLVPAGVATGLMHDQVVMVTGKVRPYVESEIKKDFVWFENGKLVDVKTKVDWNTRPAPVADSVQVVQK